MKIITFMAKHVLKYKAEMIKFTLLSLVLWSLSMFSPYTVGNYIDSLVKSSDKNVIWRAVATLAVIWTLQLLFTYAKNIISSKLNSQISFDVNYELIEHLKRLPIRYFSDKNSAYLNQRVSSDSGNVTGFVLGSAIGLLITILTFLFSLTVMFVLNFSMTLMICLIFPVYILIYFKFKQPLYELSYKLSEESNKFYSSINKQLANIKLIKQNVWSDYLGTELKTSFSSLFQTIMNNARLSYVFNNADTLVRYMANMVIFIYSGFQIIDGKMSIGQFTMINSYSLMVISSLSTFLGFGKSYRNSLVAYDRIKDILNTEQEKNGDICIDSIDGVIVKDLNFSYKDRHIIKGINMELKKGNIYAIVGENGSGKSTFVDILSGLIQDYTGEIYINRINLREINLYHLREKCLIIVEQEPILYFETLRINISLDSGKEQQINYWVKRLNLFELIESLPEGLDYNISEKTSNLSGGEKQRLAEIRAFIKNTDMLIFDEPDSALDKRSLQLLCEILQEIKDNKIIIVVTHNQLLINISDGVLNFCSDAL